jgi:membrane-bound serine protease (ClpP class)
MGTYLLWSIALFLIGVVIAVLEAILPSGGILAVAALGSLAASLYCAYQLSGAAMAIVAVLEAIVVPAAFVMAFKLLPRTSMGREMLLSPPKPGLPKTAESAPTSNSQLHGATGRAVTMLRPSGTAEIDGRRISVVTNGEMLPEGTAIKVVHVEGNRVVVEASASRSSTA